MQVVKQRRKSSPTISRFVAPRLAFYLFAGCYVVVCAIGFPPFAVAQDLPSAPVFNLESASGGRFSSEALEGKIVLVNFWATWCGPCIAEIPHWNELHRRYQEKKFVILGVTVRSGWASDIKPDVEKLKIAYPVVVGNDKVEKGFGGIWGFPTTFLVNRRGEIYKKYIGMDPKKQSQIEADIQKLLAEKP